MTSRARNVRVGLFFAITLVLIAIVLIVFGGVRFWEPTDLYHVVHEGSVYGLEPGAEVFMNGVKVGTVDELEVAGDVRQVAIAIKIKRGTPVHADTRALLQLAGITGLKVIDLQGGTPATPLLPPGSQIAAGATLLDRLEVQAQAIVDQSGVLMKRATQLTDDLIAVTDPARRAAEHLAAMSGSLEAMIGENRAALRDSLAAFRASATSAGKLIDGPLAQLVGGTGDLVGELRKLVTSNEGPLRAAMFDLRQASRNLKELARDVRQKPSRLLYSSAPPERQLP
ncbi:MAG TPA: MlaD family protein [Kofleriaceae bacterium]|nr:MlaD family protein [Kofleriaceae bacterium]